MSIKFSYKCHYIPVISQESSSLMKTLFVRKSSLHGEISKEAILILFGCVYKLTEIFFFLHIPVVHKGLLYLALGAA